MRFKLLIDKKNKDRITINPESADKLGIIKNENCNLRFGLRYCKINIFISNMIKPEELLISSNSNNLLNIPLTPQYEIRYENDEILLGPYIGILFAKNEMYLSFKSSGLYNYIKYYNDINGAIIGFSLEGVNKKDKRIKGYMYNPKTNKWDSGVYEFPASVFNAICINKKWLKYFQSVLGNSFFNSHIFNKWEMYNWLSKVPDLKSHLPETIIYRKPEDILNFLKKYSAAYIKPIFGLKGKGIIKILKNNGDFEVQTRINDQNYAFDFNNYNKMIFFLEKKLKKDNFLVQQPLNIIFNNSSIDFRIILDKDQSANWRLSGIYGRKGVYRSIVSNRSSGGKVIFGNVMLKEIFQLTDKEADDYCKNIFEIAVKAALSIDKLGFNYGKYGIDIAIDKNKKIWIIEMNNCNPNDYLPYHAGDKKTVFMIKLTNMLYAKNLAGYPSKINIISEEIKD